MFIYENKLKFNIHIAVKVLAGSVVTSACRRGLNVHSNQGTKVKAELYYNCKVSALFCNTNSVDRIQKRFTVSLS